MIKGIENLTGEQKRILFKSHSVLMSGAKKEYKKDFELVEVWVNERGVVCGRVMSGEYYHFFEDMFY